MSTATPWGASQYSKKICRGVAIHATAGHGGILVAKGFAEKNLSPAALKRGERYGTYYCYEEDCDFSIVAWEMLKKNPSLIDLFYYQNPAKPGKSAEERIASFKSSLSRWNPDYLLEIGETPTEPEYQNWKDCKQSDQLRAAKDPNFIISALAMTPQITKVWTADDKIHMVQAGTYQPKTLNYLSDCVAYDPASIDMVYRDADCPTDTKAHLEEYLKQFGNTFLGGPDASEDHSTDLTETLRDYARSKGE